MTTNYFLEGDRVVKETNGSDTLLFYYDASGSVIGFELNGTAYFYVKNLQGDITGILNNSGTLVVEYSYDSWGKLMDITGSAASTVGVKNPYRYRGYRYDTETGLYYLKSRYYDPEVKRFVNSDSTSDPGEALFSFNLFIAVGNNPICFIDINGHSIADIYNYVIGEVKAGYEDLQVFLAGIHFTVSFSGSLSATIGYSTLSCQIGASVDSHGKMMFNRSFSFGASTSAIGASFALCGTVSNAESVEDLLKESIYSGFSTNLGVLYGACDSLYFSQENSEYSGVSLAAGIGTVSKGIEAHSGFSNTESYDIRVPFPMIDFFYVPDVDVLMEAECL